jgi:UDP-galactopyranose mutase
MKRALVIGGGFAGCAAAHFLTSGNKRGWSVDLIEKESRLGAGNRTRYYGGHPYTFGPRHFLTQDEEVYRYLDSIVPIRRCQEHEFITYIERDSNFYSFPINRDDIEKMPDKEQIREELMQIVGVDKAMDFEQYWVNSVGETLYNKFVNDYNKKMWMIDDNRMFDTFKWSPKGVALKEGPRAAWDQAISGYPHESTGYDRYFEVSTAEAKIFTSTIIDVYDIEKKRVFFKGEWHAYDLIVNTISPSTLFDNHYGELPFVGRDLLKFVLPIEYAFPKDVYFVYFAGKEPFTRLVEYKKFTQHSSPHTLLTLEIPSNNGKHYPMPIKAQQARAEKYIALMPDGVFSIGRAGSYRYEVDIDDSIRQAMNIAEMV